MKLAELVQAIQSKRVWISDHADEEAQADALELDDIYFSVEHGEIINDYPTSKPYPSCLVYGMTAQDEPVHSVWAYYAKTQSAILITVYRPDPNKWIDWRTRRKSE